MTGSTLLFCLLAIASCSFAIANTGIDLDFCKKNMEDKADIPTQDIPAVRTFPINFRAFLDMTRNNQHAVEYMDLMFDNSDALLSVKLNRNDTTTMMYLDGRGNSERADELAVGESGCVDIRLGNANDSKFFNLVKKDANGHTIYGTSEDILRYSRGNTNNIYIGTSLSREDIPSEAWQSCQYIDDSKTTSLVTFEFASTDVTMPYYDNSKYSILLTATVMSNNRNDFRYDYVNIGPITSAQYNNLLPKPVFDCWSKLYEPNMPLMPRTFSFQGEMIVIKDPTQDPPPPGEISAFWEIYSSKDDFVVIDSLTKSTGNYGDIGRTIHDFKLGISYTFDKISNDCTVRSIPADGVDTIVSGGKVKQRTPEEFFNLNLKYQYYGEVRQAMRGIDCDVYVASDEANKITYRWYFASFNWKNNIVDYEVATPLPVAFQVTTNSVDKLLNIYEFSTKPSTKKLRVGRCFNRYEARRVIMDFEIDRTTMNDAIVNRYAPIFLKRVTDAIMVHGKVWTSLRLSIPIFWVQKDKTIRVVFWVRGSINGADTLTLKRTFLSADTIVKNIETSVKQKSLVIYIENGDEMIATATAKSIRSRRHWGTKDNTSDNGYSAGSMAGIGIGLLVAGLLLGFLGFFIYRKKSGIGGSASGFGMNKLEDSS